MLVGRVSDDNQKQSIWLSRSDDRCQEMPRPETSFTIASLEERGRYGVCRRTGTFRLYSVKKEDPDANHPVIVLVSQ